MENLPKITGLDFSPENNLSKYLQDIRKYPILEPEEEYKLAVDYQKTKNANIAAVQWSDRGNIA